MRRVEFFGKRGGSTWRVEKSKKSINKKGGIFARKGGKSYRLLVYQTDQSNQNHQKRVKKTYKKLAKNCKKESSKKSSNQVHEEKRYHLCKTNLDSKNLSCPARHQRALKKPGNLTTKPYLLCLINDGAFEKSQQSKYPGIGG